MYVLSLLTEWSNYKPFNRSYHCSNALVADMKFRTVIIKSFGEHREDIEEEFRKLVLDKSDDSFWKLVGVFEKQLKGSVELKKVRPIKEDRMKEEFEKACNKVIIKDIIE